MVRKKGTCYNAEKSVVEARLRRELKRLQRKIGLGSELVVAWMPNCVKRNVDGGRLSGEVLGNTVYVYEESVDEAIKTLKHEFFDYIISYHIEKPYKDFINRFISLFEYEMYKRKEKLVDRLSQLI